MKDFKIPRQQKVEQLSKEKETKPRFSGLDKLSYFFALLCVLFLAFIVWQIPGFLFSTVTQINIIGNESLSNEKIIKDLQLPEGLDWYNTDPYILSRRLKLNPLIETAMVKRNSLFGIDVIIREKKPVAFLKTKQQLFLLGKNNLILQRVDGTKALDLPVIVNTEISRIKTGDILDLGSLGKAYQVMDFLSHNPVLPLEAVSEIIVSNPLNIQLITIPHGLRIKLGVDDFENKLARLYESGEELAKIRKQIAYIDLRSPKGIVIKRK